MTTRIYTPQPNKPSRTLHSIYGDCLEKARLYIPNEGQAIIDCSISPKVGDLVYCDNSFGTIHGFIKQVKEIKDDVIIVGTAYADESRDFTFEASVIYGVVTEVFDRVFGKQVYCRQTEKGGESDA